MELRGVEAPASGDETLEQSPTERASALTVDARETEVEEDKRRNW